MSDNLVIARCSVDMPSRKCSYPCDHAKPHKHKYDEFVLHPDYPECDCIPVGLEYYMREILNEEGGEQNESEKVSSNRVLGTDEK